MKKIVRLIITLTPFVFFLNSYSQDLPKIIPPAPETSALFRFQGYPMDYSTGLPQINIPIYEIKSGTLSIPIGISYHASGRRVSDVDGPISAGWALNAGGMISRTIYNSEDFGIYKFPYPFNIFNINPINDLDYLKEIIHWNYYQSPGLFKDSEYDIFSYSVGNLNGKFIFKDINNVKTAALLPYKPYIINPIFYNGENGGYPGLGSIEITDDKGVYYLFSGNERENFFTSGAVTGYSLAKIISADKADTISFTYTTQMQHRISISQSWIVDDYAQTYTVNGQSGGNYLDGFLETPTQFENTNSEAYQIARISEIDFRDGKVVFNLVANSDKIDNIQILNRNNEVIKTIQFVTSKLANISEGNLPINKLDKIIFKDKAGVAVENYGFEYFPVKYASGIDYIDLRHCDYWGYYNASGIHDMIPYYNVDYVGAGGAATIGFGSQNANRKPFLEALKSGVLKKITFPTGGTTEFNYENNKYFSYTTNQITDGPGLRVSQIVTSDNKGVINYKTYKYGVSESGYTTIELEPTLNSKSTQLNFEFLHCLTADDFSPGGCGNYRRRTYLSGFIPELNELASRPINYTEVTEYNGTFTTNSGKTVNKYDYIPWAASGMSYGVMHISNWNYWNNSALINQTIYKINQSLGSYQKIKETSNSYTVNTIEDVVGLHVGRLWSIPQGGRNLSSNYPALADAETYALYNRAGTRPTLPLMIYSYADYHIPVGVKNLKSMTETLFYDDGSSIKNTTTYTYNSYQYISQTSRTTSDGSTLLSNTTYPSDYTGNSTLTQMVSPTVNMLNFPIEKSDIKNGNPIKSIRTNYINWGGTNPNIAPQTVDVKEGNALYETKLRFYNYDSNGNPLSISKENNIVQSYIWDYNKAHPIAEVINATASNIAYTSFEADGTGNWSGMVRANVKSDLVGITGKKYYNLTGSTLSIAGLTTTTTYIVSYWSKSGSCTVNGTPLSGWPQNLRTVTINGVTWNYWEHHITGVSTGNVSGSVSIDELRLYPITSQMTSYTYEPLIGLTSQTDKNNIISYYEYDTYNRLKLIKDFNGNILKTINYAYQSTTP
jgi:hypothetical protein